MQRVVSKTKLSRRNSNEHKRRATTEQQTINDSILHNSDMIDIIPKEEIMKTTKAEKPKLPSAQRSPKKPSRSPSKKSISPVKRANKKTIDFESV